MSNSQNEADKVTSQCEVLQIETLLNEQPWLIFRKESLSKIRWKRRPLAFLVNRLDSNFDE